MIQPVILKIGARIWEAGACKETVERPRAALAEGIGLDYELQGKERGRLCGAWVTPMQEYLPEVQTEDPRHIIRLNDWVDDWEIGLKVLYIQRQSWIRRDGEIDSTVWLYGSTREGKAQLVEVNSLVSKRLVVASACTNTDKPPFANRVTDVIVFPLLRVRIPQVVGQNDEERCLRAKELLEKCWPQVKVEGLPFFAEGAEEFSGYIVDPDGRERYYADESHQAACLDTATVDTSGVKKQTCPS